MFVIILALISVISYRGLTEPRNVEKLSDLAQISTATSEQSQGWSQGHLILVSLTICWSKGRILADHFDKKGVSHQSWLMPLSSGIPP